VAPQQQLGSSRLGPAAAAAAAAGGGVADARPGDGSAAGRNGGRR
jgi:hypothetical protein